MNILKLVKKSGVTRRYNNRPLPRKAIKKIVDAGAWSLSVHGFQPWKFVLIKDKRIINDIAKISREKSKMLFAGMNLLLKSTADTIENAPIIIAIYNDSKMSKLAKRLGRSYQHYAKIVELQAIGAAIQNMFLQASNLGIGMAWLCAPLFCEKKLDNLLQEEQELVALLSFGYSSEIKTTRGKRKKRDDLIRILNYKI